MEKTETPKTKRPQMEAPDIREHGASIEDKPQISNRRLFCQLQVFTGCQNPQPLAEALKKASLESVLYLDVNNPTGVGIFVLSESPDTFPGQLRELLMKEPFSSLTLKPEMTMLGRTYSTGHERDLEDWLLKKPRRNAFNPKWPWAIWYPLRRKGEFEQLPQEQKGKILYEHAHLGMAYGAAGFASDIRLACHGLDKNDNEFVLGIVGPELYPLSRLIQDMRKTQQTSKYIQSMGACRRGAKTPPRPG